MPRKELGEILREADLINDTQLAEALTLQRTFGERLASILVRQKILTEKFAVTYLGRQLGVPPVDLSKAEIDLGILDVLPLDLCERHLVFPVKVEGTRLQVAMSDPVDHVLVSEIEFKTGVRLAPMIALESSIKNAIIEARRALKAGPAPDLPQRPAPPRGRGIFRRPRRAGPARCRGRRRRPSAPVAALEEKERAIFETLAGAPITTQPPTPAVRVPAVEEVQTILAVDDDDAILRLMEQILARTATGSSRRAPAARPSRRSARPCPTW